MSFIKTLAKKIINRLPTKKLIIFESAPDLSDNTKAVFDEMIKRGMNEKYEMLWLLSKEPTDSLPKIKNVKYVKMENTKKILLTKYMARCFICCNDWLESLRGGQTSFFRRKNALCGISEPTGCGGGCSCPPCCGYCVCRLPPRAGNTLSGGVGGGIGNGALHQVLCHAVHR